IEHPTQHLVVPRQGRSKVLGVPRSRGERSTAPSRTVERPCRRPEPVWRGARRPVSWAAMSEATEILDAISGGDPTAAGRLLPLVYDELRRLAAQRLARENPGQTLQATALVHEAYVRLVASPGQASPGR